MAWQVKNIVELNGSQFFDKKSYPSYNQLPFDSLARIQLSCAEVSLKDYRKSGSQILKKIPVDYYQSKLSQNELSDETLKMMLQSDPEGPDILITISHFPNEDWFDFLNMRLLNKLSKKCHTYSIIGMGMLGLPMAFHHIQNHVPIPDMKIWIIATDVVIAPFERHISHLGLISDSSVGIELIHNKIEGYLKIEKVDFTQAELISSWYKTFHPMKYDSTSLGKHELYEAIRCLSPVDTNQSIIFKDACLGTGTIHLKTN